jgi:WD40 repeat protein
VNSIVLEGRAYSDLPIHLSPDNRRALVQESTPGGGVYLRVRDLTTGDILLHEPEDYNTEAGFRPDGTVIWWQPWVISSEDSSEIGHHLYRTPDNTTNIVASMDVTRIATFDGARVNIYLWDTAGGRDPLVLQGHTAPVREVIFSPDARLLVSFDANDEMRVWDTATGENLTTIPDGLLPNGMHAGQGRWLFRAQDGRPMLWDMAGAFNGLISPVGGSLSISADGTTIIAANRSVVLLFGIPSAQRPAYASVPAAVVPSGINVRPQPSLDAAPSGTVERGFVIVAGRDVTGQFVYLPSADGWALADPAYINLGDIPVMELPVRGETG